MSAAEQRPVDRDPGVVLNAIRDRCEKVVRVKAQSFDALCPCHDDTKPSLHVAIGDVGVVMTCRACGATSDDVLARLNVRDPYFDELVRRGIRKPEDDDTLTTAGLFAQTRYGDASGSTRRTKPKPVAKVDDKPKPPPKPKSTPTRFGSSVPDDDRARLLAAVDVLDRLDVERGIDRDTVERCGLGLSIDGRVILPTYDRDGEPSPRLWKPFPEQRSDPSDKMMGAQGASPDLYPRPETKAYPDGSDVLLVEGEADALVAITNGLQAVGCPGTQTWQDSDAHRFVRFGRVTVIADADGPGRKWAKDVARDLRAVGCRVVVRDFGDRVDKGFDLTDFALRCRADNLDLASAIDRLQVAIAGGMTTDLFGDPGPRAAPTVGGVLFYPGSTHVLFGHGGAGKTYLFLVAARDEIRNGGRVLFVDYETGGDTIRHRLDELGFTDDEKARFHHLDVKGGKARPLDGQAEYIAELLDTFAPTLIGVDSWSSVHGAGNFGDVKDDEPVERVLAQVFRPLTRDGAALVILDHFPKGESATKGYPFGSQRKQSGTHVVIEAKAAGTGRVKIVSWKDNVGDRATGGELIADYTYGGGMAAIVPVEPGRKPDKSSRWRPTGFMERVSIALEEAGPDGLTATQLEQGIVGKSSHVRAARDVLVDEGYATRTSSSEGVAFTTTRFVSVKPYREADDVNSDNVAAE